MMQMTENEICFRFRRNGSKRKHIRILAELNAVEPEIIEEILTKKGFLQWRKYSQNHEKSNQNL